MGQIKRAINLMEKKKNIFIAGHRGMVGSAILRKLKGRNNANLVVRSRNELDLLQQTQVDAFFKGQQIDEVYLAAARVGGIFANKTYPAQFIHENLLIQSNIIHSAFTHGVKKLLFLGSSCIYPKFANQPIRESDLLTGPLEPTNEPYAIAKIAGIKMCESYSRQYGKTHGVDYRSVMPTNLYGPGDSYHPENSHVLPALIRKFHEAKILGQEEVEVWGTGNALREFLHSDDLALGCIFIMNLNVEKYEKVTELGLSHINIGSGKEVSIRDLAHIISKIIGYEGVVKFDSSKPDGTPRKLMDCSIINRLGWSSKIGLREGIIQAYENFKLNHL